MCSWKIRRITITGVCRQSQGFLAQGSWRLVSRLCSSQGNGSPPPHPCPCPHFHTCTSPHQLHQPDKCQCNRCSCALPGELRGKRELLSRAREGHLPASAPIPIRAPTRAPTSAPTRDPTPTSEGQEPDYASIVSVDDRLEEVGFGEYRWMIYNSFSL